MGGRACHGSTTPGPSSAWPIIVGELLEETDLETEIGSRRAPGEGTWYEHFRGVGQRKGRTVIGGRRSLGWSHGELWS